MSLYPNQSAPRQAPLKTVLCLDSPTLIVLRPLCPVCRERIAIYKLETGDFGFCRECRPVQTDPNADFETQRDLYQRNACITPQSLEIAQSGPGEFSSDEIARRNAWHCELLHAEAQITELTAAESASLAAGEALERQGCTGQAQWFFHDAHACYIERAWLLNRYGADLGFALPESIEGEGA